MKHVPVKELKKFFNINSYVLLTLTAINVII